MSGPITNFELGKMRRREYEAEVSPLWGQNIDRDDKPRQPKKYRLVLALSGAVLTILLLIQMFVL